MRLRTSRRNEEKATVRAGKVRRAPPTMMGVKEDERNGAGSQSCALVPQKLAAIYARPHIE
jgi:hypothetical protein